MSEFGTKRFVICPECGGEISPDAVMNHFRQQHARELPVSEMVELVAQVRTRPLTEKEYFAQLDQQDQNRRAIERTPRSMQQWDSNGPRPGRSGPLGPG